MRYNGVMLNRALETVRGLLSDDVTAVYFVLISILSIFLFWRSVLRTLAVEEGAEGIPENATSRMYYASKIFDLLIVTFILSLVVSRITYRLINPDLEDYFRVFWLPYEKIDGVVYLFSSFSWVILRMWDGRLIFEGLVLGWMVSMAGVSRIFKIPWGSISNAVSDFFWIWFIGIELYYSVLFTSWVPLLVAAILVMLGYLRWRTNHGKDKQGGHIRHRVVSTVWKLGTIVGVPTALLTNDLYWSSIAGRGVLLVITGISIGIGVWILAGDLLEFLNILTSSTTEGTDVAVAEVSRPMSGADFGLNGELGWRRFTKMHLEKKRHPSSRPPRNFSLSYRNFADTWLNVGALFHRIIKRRGRDSRDI